LELLESKVTESDSRRVLARAADAATQGGQLVVQILAFSRRQNLDPQSIDLSKIIVKMKNMLSRTLGLTVSGVAATRRSKARLSLRIAIFIAGDGPIEPRQVLPEPSPPQRI
jgi:hypothetical protein